MDFVTNDNPFAGRVICGCCGSTFGRKVCNSIDERLKRTIWQCNSKYKVKGKIGCGNRHINEKVLYQVFVDAFNELVKNIDYYMTKWEKQIESEDILERVTAKRFINVFNETKPIENFDAGLYFKLVEKIMVYEDGISVELLDGSEIKCA
ncbi:recombinase zinc beta ribbon domain-containing protein [Ruminiclostridium herbifermentans]|uniref:Recombinase zinc beta ribbon domain-containing protein n=1 Tax=Ruminiclostridium herbifermentans TaxID=2488810 RepID=A0A4U7JHU5_9FIRM|nr:zinc ribbon domain-containing protein [Ruminiclostridium herbifermentans]QNU66270.1 recombinase zinc beta ribbon domain-containing protein [Ruminiclostridium herbifermentans]